MTLTASRRSGGRWSIQFAVSFGLSLTQAMLAIASADQPDVATVEAGQRLYREGVLLSGQSLQAIGQGGLALSGAAAACINCHRRSGMGNFEGGKPVKAVTASALFSDRQAEDRANFRLRLARTHGRPMYDAQNLRAALTTGRDSGGNLLDPLMPRYRLSDADFDALRAYLSTLSAAATPGVTPTDIHFSTIVSAPDTPEHHAAQLAVLQHYVDDKNSQPRLDAKRAQQAERTGDLMYRRYRRWNVHVWRLSGPEHTWPDQLRAYYTSQPVFAVLGGAVAGSWSPIHVFCERYSLPCLFPETNFPVVDRPSFYTLYFSQGYTLDGRVAAAYLARNASALLTGPIVQIYRDESGGAVAARAFRESLAPSSRAAVHDVVWPATATLSTTQLAALLPDAAPAVLLLWLDDVDMRHIRALAPLSSRSTRVFMSARETSMEALTEIARVLQDVFVIYPYALPPTRTKSLRRMKAWLAPKHVELTDEIVQSNMFFAVSLAGEALKHGTDDFSREYFVERIEEMTENLPISSAYHHVSLGPSQRFASRGEFVARWSRVGGAYWYDNAEWVVP